MNKTNDIYYPTSEIEKTFINSIWRLSENDLNTRKERILPKGTIEIIFNLSDSINYFNPSFQISKTLPTIFINGLNFKPFELTKTGRLDFLGIQLSCIGLRLLFNIPVKEFNNCVYEGKEICAELDILADELFFKQSFSQQVEILVNWIRKRTVASNCQNSIGRVQHLINLNCNPNVTVKKLSDEICLSDRQLRRFSQDWLGMTTEEFILYNKYLKSLNLLHYSNQTLTEIGLITGYYDQSHFIREFKSYTEITPRYYKEANTGLPGHIFL
jgi:AraC-like DNA-binding protein